MKKIDGNFTMIPNNFINDTRLDVYEFRVLCYLLKLSDDNFCCYPSYDTIAKETGMSLSKTMRVIKKLISYNVIAKECRETKSNDHNTNFYTICVDEETAESVAECEKGSVCETEGGVCETEGSVCEAEGSVCETEGGVCETPNQYIYTNNQYKNTQYIKTPLSTLEALMERAGTDNLEGELKKNFEKALEIMYMSKSITVGGAQIPMERVRRRLENISYEHIATVDRNKPMHVENGKLVDDVRNPVAYIISALYNTLRYTEDEIMEMEYGGET